MLLLVTQMLFCWQCLHSPTPWMIYIFSDIVFAHNQYVPKTLSLHSNNALTSNHLFNIVAYLETMPPHTDQFDFDILWGNISQRGAYYRGRTQWVQSQSDFNRRCFLLTTYPWYQSMTVNASRPRYPTRVHSMRYGFLEYLCVNLSLYICNWCTEWRWTV